jgi:SAM-dependent methyltransferase
MGLLLDWLKLPETKNHHDLDSISTSLLHADIIKKKKFLRRLYVDFYRSLIEPLHLNDKNSLIIELGSGGGFLKEIYPGVVTSDIKKMPMIDRQFSATDMPFEDGSVDAFVGQNILHHINDMPTFLWEMNRCLKANGQAIFIEPANTHWGRFVYQHFHHEMFEPNAGWTFEQTGPLSGGNGALPWIVFCRDRERFIKEFPSLQITSVTAHTPFRYLLSGGVSMKQLVPNFLYGTISLLERLLGPLNNGLGMFITIQIKKTISDDYNRAAVR